MIIIADYFLYNIEGEISKRYPAELNILNGLLKIQYDYFSDEGNHELVVVFFEDTLKIQLKSYKFEKNKNSIYCTTFN